MYGTLFSTLACNISNMFAKLFELKTIQVEQQATTEIIDDKKDYKKATNIAEKIITISQKYKTEMTFADRLNFGHLVQKFQKYN